MGKKRRAGRLLLTLIALTLWGCKSSPPLTLDIPPLITVPIQYAQIEDGRGRFGKSTVRSKRTMVRDSPTIDIVKTLSCGWEANRHLQGSPWNCEMPDCLSKFLLSPAFLESAFQPFPRPFHTPPSISKPWGTELKLSRSAAATEAPIMPLRFGKPC